MRFAIRLGPPTFGIFAAFPDESGRQAHLSGRVAAALLANASELCAPVVRKNVVTLPALQAGTHDASHQGWDGLPPVDVLEVGVGVVAAGQAGTGAAAGYLAPRPCAGVLHCNTAPIL